MRQHDAIGPRTFAIVNGSCHRRHEEMAAVRRFLSSNSWREHQDFTQSDLVILFACGAFRVNVHDMLASVGELRHRMRDGAELIVGGCLPGTDGVSLREAFGGRTITYTDSSSLDMLAGITEHFDAFPPLFGRDSSCLPLEAPSPVRAARLVLNRLPLGFARFLMRHWSAPILRKVAARLRRDERMSISIAAGCARTCPYCAKRFAWGALRSKPVELVMQRISEGTLHGYRTFDLFADSIGDYGQDLGVDLGELLDRIADYPASISIGIYDLHPQDFLRYFDRIMRLCRADRLHYIYVITESGNDRVLESMNRSIDRETLVARLLEIRNLKNVFMQTAIIVGYPGETDAEFEDTLKLLDKVDFDDVFVHSYCDMPNTESTRLSGKISREIMSARIEKIGATRIRHNREEARRELDHAFESTGSGR